jgi:hypothetical protein
MARGDVDFDVRDGVVTDVVGQRHRLDARKNPRMAELGRLGGLKRAERTSEDERRSDARRAVNTRWQKRAATG